MYQSFFGFRQRPFAAAVQLETYYPAAAIEAARQTLVRCIARGEGTGVILGPSGTGKSLLCRVLAEDFRREMQVALVGGGGLSSPRALLQAVLYALGRPYRGMDDGELRLALVDYLTLDADCQPGCLLLVDEAHLLPLRLIDELRLLTNLARGPQPQVRLVLAGGAALEEKLASPRLDSFNQRIVARCYLQSFTRNETAEYIRAVMTAAGGDAARLVTDDACQAVFRATDGIARLINQLCDHALLLAYVAGQRSLSASEVETAWADLQQLPTPWNMSTHDTAASAPAQATASIEFGQLDDGFEPSATTPCHEALPAEPATIEPAARDAGAIGGACDLAMASDAAQDETATVETWMEASAEPRRDDYRPAAARGAEVELVFDDISPLNESFAEEEVVVDRYARPHLAAAMADDEAAAGLPDVMRRADSELAACQRVMEEELAEKATAAFNEGSATAARSAAQAAPAHAAAEDDNERWPLDELEGPCEIELEPATLPLPRRLSTLELSPSERAPLERTARDRRAVAEADIDPAPTLPTPRVKPVSPRQFRHLFSQLRRDRVG